MDNKEGGIVEPTVFKNFEIVGFDGKPEGVCGRAEGLALNLSNGKYIKWPLNEQDIERMPHFSKKEVDEFEKEGALTILQSKFPAHIGNIILYVQKSLFQDLSIKPPEKFFDILIEWKLLPSDVYITSIEHDLSTQILDDWGRTAFAFCQKELEKYFISKEISLLKKANKFADYALTLAKNDSLRSQIYICMGIIYSYSELPLELSNLYDFTIHIEYPDLEWEMYWNEVKIFEDILRHRIESESGKELVERIRPITILKKTIENLKKDKTREQTIDVREKIARSVQRYSYPADHDYAIRMAQLISKTGSTIDVDEQLANLLLVEPTTYAENSLIVSENKCRIHGISFMLNFYTDQANNAKFSKLGQIIGNMTKLEIK